MSKKKVATKAKKKARKRGIGIWLGVSAAIGALLIAANFVLTNIVPGFMDMTFGGDRSVKTGATGSNQYYTTNESITDKASAVANANEVNEKINEEGYVLLKNANLTETKKGLPLTTSASDKLKVSVFGKNSVNLAYGSSGSVGAKADNAKTIFDSLEAANFEYNPVLKNFYEDKNASGAARPSGPAMTSNSIVAGFATGETPESSYTEAVRQSFAQYNDAALVVITRVSGENYDLPQTMRDDKGNAISGAYSKDDHYLELDKNEQDMIRLACENFDNVILLINSGTPLELGFLDEHPDGDNTVLDYDFAKEVNAALWIGLPGETGIMALGRILNGTVNPSGRVADTYARDFMSIPAAANFSCNGQENSDNYFLNQEAQREYFIDYEEGIYVGYKYFETRGYTDGEDWYKDNVIYPFGYGESYTTFTQEIVDTNIKEVSNWNENTQELSITVKVTNTGDRTGKEVVQIYATPKYYEGQIEKSHKVLVGFEKVEVTPNEPVEVTITFDPYDFASYDYNNANGNDFTGYELDAGEYVFTVGKNSHDAWDTITTELTTNVQFKNDTTTGYEVVNRFDNIDEQLKEENLLSRADWEGTWPAMRSAQEKEVSASFISGLDSKESYNPLTAQDVAEINAKRPPAKALSLNPDLLQLHDLIGIDSETGMLIVTEDESQWDQLVSRLTLKSIWDVVSQAGFTTGGIPAITKPKTIDADGPSGFTAFMGDPSVHDTAFYCCQSLVAATWSKELSYEFGVAVGNESLIGYSYEIEGETQVMTYSGWYAPGVNLHRSPFGGRNPEYYSEDSVFSGQMAAELIKGAASKGVYTFMKHFAANDQETHRGGVCTWLTEQAYRETYLKPFEIAVKDGKATGIMTSFNRVGTTWTGGDYRLMTEVLRNEWGFKGTALTDFASGQSHMDIEQMIYAGGDTWLDSISPSWDYDTNDPVDVYVMQEAIEHVLYTVAQSNAMNGLGEGVIYETRPSLWRMTLSVVNVAVPVVLLAWGAVVIVLAVKKKK